MGKNCASEANRSESLLAVLAVLAAALLRAGRAALLESVSVTRTDSLAKGRLTAELRELPGLPRLLIGTQLAFNIGFYAVLPYLADHLGAGLGLAGWLVGLVLGLRTFSQQGLFIVGGALTDRYGPRPVVLAGCALRVAGFVWLGFADATWAVIGSVLVVGFAAALFSPAVESEAARQAVAYEEAGGLPRTRVLALFSVAGQIGAFTGPLIGALLLAVDFRAACLGAAGVFVCVLAGHARLMPHRPPAADRTPRHRTGTGTGTGAGTGTGLLLLARNRRFLGLALGFSAYVLAYNQLYLALPREVARATGSQRSLGWLFALSSVLVITAQLPVTRWASRRLSPRAAAVAGLLLVAAGFAVVAAALPLDLTGAPGLLPGVGLVVLLTLGQMLIVPAVRGRLPDLAEEGRLGLYTGALASVSGAVVLVGSAATGSLLDLADGSPGTTALVWLALAALPVAGAGLVARSSRPVRSCPGDHVRPLRRPDRP